MSLEEEIAKMTTAVTALTAAVTALDTTVQQVIPAIGSTASGKTKPFEWIK